jgi:hypothetical protein
VDQQHLMGVMAPQAYGWAPSSMVAESRRAHKATAVPDG